MNTQLHFSIPQVVMNNSIAPCQLPPFYETNVITKHEDISKNLSSEPSAVSFVDFCTPVQGFSFGLSYTYQCHLNTTDQ